MAHRGVHPRSRPSFARGRMEVAALYGAMFLFNRKKFVGS